MGKIDKNLRLGNRERMIRACLNQDIDRVPYWFMFGPWGETIDRWRGEGLGDNECYEPFGFDTGFRWLPIDVGFIPRYERKILKVEGDKRTVRDESGITYIEKIGHSTIPYYLDYPVKTRADWEELKEARLNPDLPERFPENWSEEVKSLKESDAAIQVGSWPYGLFGTLREFMGVEALLVTFYDDPELIHDMMDYLTDYWLKIYRKALNDIQIDHIHIWEDMSGKQGSMISPAMFREFMTPNYKKIVSFAKEHDISVISVDTDGNMDDLMPLLDEAGINFCLPFEVQAGCDVVAYRKKYPGICIHGGIDKRMIAEGKPAIDRELERIAPLLEESGYIPAPDHLPHPEISYENFCYFVNKLKDMIFRQ